jgi:hypothetical protein
MGGLTMRRVWVRPVSVVATLLLGILALAAPVSAVVGWTLVGGPLIATMFTSTTYTFTATNLTYGSGIGCVEIQLPDQFVIESLGDPVPSDSGHDWSSGLYGGTNWVLAHATGGGGRLDILESVTFTITATATSAGDWFWNTHAHRRQDCTGPDIEAGIWPMVVNPIAPPSAPPTPVPTAVPTVVPTPIPTLVPTPPPLPIGTPQPTATPAASSSGTPRPTPTGSPRPTPEVIAGAPAAPPGGSGTPVPLGRMAPLAESDTSAIGLGTEVFALLEGPLVWFVPSAVMGGPGLLILLFVALQAGGALAWIPAVKRMSGEPLPVQRRRRPGS